MLMIEQLSQSQVGRVTPVRAIVAAGRGLAALPVARHAAADAKAFPQKRPTIYFPLRRYPVGERVGVKRSVITQTIPRTVLFARLRDAVFFTRCKIIPRIVASDR